MKFQIKMKQLKKNEDTEETEEVEETEESDAEESDETDETESEETDGETPTGIQKFATELGISEEDNIDLSQYKNSLDGAAKLNNDFSEVKAQRLATTIVKDTFANFPDLAKFYQHSVVDGKSTETFLLKHHVDDYSKIDISAEDGQKQILSHYYKNIKGLDDSIIGSVVDKYESEGKLKEGAEAVKTEMDQSKASQIQQQEEQEAQLYQQQQEENNRIINEVKTVINKGSLGELKLKPSEMKQFENDLFTADNSGNSKVTQAYSELTTEERLQIDYLTLNKDKLKGLFSNKKKTSKKESLDKAFDDNSKRSSMSKNFKKDKGFEGSPLDNVSGFNIKSLLGN